MPIRALSAVICLLLVGHSAADQSMQCTPSVAKGEATVRINVVTPHPKELILHRPGKPTVWLRTDDIEHKFPESEDFSNLDTFEITSLSRGTVYENGQSKLVPILDGPGLYHLILAGNVETELDNTPYHECEFTLDSR